jgi:hypothetical protein
MEKKFEKDDIEFTKKLKLCRKGLCFLYDLRVNHVFKRIPRKMKIVNSSDILSSTSVYPWDHQIFFNKATFREVDEIFSDNELVVGRAEKQAALVRASFPSLDAKVWMDEYFSRYESQPNCSEIHVDATWKKTIYEEYKNDVLKYQTAGQKPISLSQFKILWKSCFNFVKIRKIKRVSGKCWTCSYINELRNMHKGKEYNDAAKSLMIMHRGGNYMLERLEYRRRVAEAMYLSPNKVMSTIIDGASQNHCQIPHRATLVDFHDGLKQHIEGCLTHGHQLTIYRSFPTVDADSDFTIYCLLKELSKWTRANNDEYPETWYIQIDGGSENANKYLLAALEWLVIKRFVKKILLTRLPVGHTHEDIDACFGTIATWYDSRICMTPQQYKADIEAAFLAEDSYKLRVEVEDVFVVPDYQHFFGKYIDKHFQRMHKQEWTQHQFRFEAVPVTDLFPCGSKFTFRKYSSDRVVLIEKKMYFSVKLLLVF